MEVTPKLQMEGASMAAGLERLPVQESCATLPTFQPEDLATTQAPVEDRGFLDGQYVGLVYVAAKVARK